MQTACGTGMTPSFRHCRHATLAFFAFQAIDSIRFHFAASQTMPSIEIGIKSGFAKFNSDKSRAGGQAFGGPRTRLRSKAATARQATTRTIHGICGRLRIYGENALSLCLCGSVVNSFFLRTKFTTKFTTKCAGRVQSEAARQHRPTSQVGQKEWGVIRDRLLNEKS